MTQEALSLTDQERARIKKLREAGHSYRSIAQETGISIGAVKMFFQRHKEGSIAVSRCEQCHKPLRQDIIRAGRRFCSDLCRVNWWSAHPEKIEGHGYQCQTCGKRFFSRKPAKFCSRACFYASRKKGEQA